MLQLVALQAVWQTIFFPMDFQRKVAVDDAFDDGYPAFRGGMPFPVDYQSLFSSQNHNGGVGVDGVNWVVLFVLVFCCFCATLATVPELDSVKAGFLLLAERAHACLVDRRKLTGDVACRHSQSAANAIGESSSPTRRATVELGWYSAPPLSTGEMTKTPMSRAVASATLRALPCPPAPSGQPAAW